MFVCCVINKNVKCITLNRGFGANTNENMSEIALPTLDKVKLINCYYV